MKSVVALVLLVAAVVVKAQRTPDLCKTCVSVLDSAARVTGGRVADAASLQAILDRECASTDDARACTALVDNNIRQIFADVSAGAASLRTCTDIGACGRGAN